jgi:hypothetical protein
MTTFTPTAFEAARHYLFLNARLIERLRFAFHFGNGRTAPILSALRAYQNEDGGFGLALEPDLRGPMSEPQHVEIAFWMLDEIGAFDDQMVGRAYEWLAANSTDEGGVPFVLDDVDDAPHAPWWQPETGADGRLLASINPTAPIAGLLHAHGVDHPWLATATEFCWNRIADMKVAHAYDTMCILAFLERVDDRARAEAEFERLADALRATIALDPDAEGHVHSPLDVAPRPDSMAARLFEQADVDRHLDALIESQAEDGGWLANFPMWTPIVAHEWGGYITIQNLKVLRNWGRLP